MRAPDQKFSGYSEAWWSEIKSIFARLEIDVDAVQIERRFCKRPGEYVDGRWSLRSELEFLARLVTIPTRGAWRPSRKERIKQLAAALKAGKTYRAYLSPDSPMLAAITDLDRWIARDLTELKTERPSTNAARPEEDGFRELLLETWNRTVACTTTVKRGRRKLLVDFLFACTDPIFPTTKVAIGKWLDRRQSNA